MPDTLEKILHRIWNRKSRAEEDGETIVRLMERIHKNEQFHDKLENDLFVLAHDLLEAIREFDPDRAKKFYRRFLSLEKDASHY